MFLTKIERRWSLDDFYHTLAPMLFVYEHWKIFLDNSQHTNNQEVQKNAKAWLDIWSRAIRLQVGELHKNQEFLNRLVGYCAERGYKFDPLKILSDALSERHKAKTSTAN